MENQFLPELEQDERGPCLQRHSPSNKSTNGFPGMIVPLQSTLIKCQIISNNLYLSTHKHLLTGSFATSCSSTENGIVSSVCSARQGPFVEPAFHVGISSSVPNSLPSLGRMESIGTQSGVAESGHLQGPLKFDIRSTPSLHPHSLPEYHDGLTNGAHCHSLGPMAANINIKPSEIIDNRQLSRVSSNGRSIGFNEGGK